MSDSVTNFSVQHLQDIIQSNAEDRVRVDAIKTLLELRDQNKKPAKKMWYNASVSEIGLFLVKAVVAALPAVFLAGVFYILTLILINVASQLIL